MMLEHCAAEGAQKQHRAQKWEPPASSQRPQRHPQAVMVLVTPVRLVSSLHQMFMMNKETVLHKKYP